MESISITRHYPVQMRPPAYGYPIENSRLERIDQPKTETFIEQQILNDRKDALQVINEKAAISGRVPNGPIDFGYSRGSFDIDILA